MFDPISLGLTAASLLTSVIGSSMQASAARRAAQSQRQISGLEMQVEQQRKKAMELDARRRSLEVIRQGQRARAMALTVGTAQGASKGSVMGGAFGQIQGQTEFNLAGIQENLNIGRNIFGINQQISQQRQNIATQQGNAATGAGISSLGGALMSATPQLSSLARSAPGIFGGPGGAASSITGNTAGASPEFMGGTYTGIVTPGIFGESIRDYGRVR